MIFVGFFAFWVVPSVVRDFEILPCQSATEPIRLFKFCFYSQIVKDELAV